MYDKLGKLSKHLYDLGLYKQSENIMKIAEFSKDLKLKVFDFDDTVAETESRIIVIKDKGYIAPILENKDRELTEPEIMFLSGKIIFDDLSEESKKSLKDSSDYGGTIYTLTPQELLSHEISGEEEYDFREFKHIIRPKPIGVTKEVIKNIKNKNERILSKQTSEVSKPSEIKVLTARGSDAQIHIKKFFKDFFDIDLTPENIITLGSKDPNAKADKILEWARSGKYSEIEFFDDSKKNIEAVRKQMEEKNAGGDSVRVILRQVFENANGEHTTGYTRGYID